MGINNIVLYWFLFVSVSALIGSFTGTLLALAVQGLVKKINKRTEN